MSKTILEGNYYRFTLKGKPQIGCQLLTPTIMNKIRAFIAEHSKPVVKKKVVKPTESIEKGLFELFGEENVEII